jgi:hypothetical protein
MRPITETPEMIREKVRRLLDSARGSTDHEAKGKLLAEALNLAQLAEVMERERVKISEKL